LTEGSEEVAQGLVSNSLKVYGWKGTENLYEDIVDGLLENFVGGFLSGGVLGTVRPNIIEDLSADLKRKLDRDGVRNKDGTKIPYEDVETTVLSIAEKMALRTKDIATVAEKRLREQAGLLKTEVVPRKDSDQPLVAKLGRYIYKDRDRVKIDTTAVEAEGERPFNELDVDQQKLASNNMDTFLQTLNLRLAQNRKLQLGDERLPRRVQEQLQDISAKAIKENKAINQQEVLDIFRKNDVYIVGGELDSAATGVFYGPAMLRGEWGYTPSVSAEKFISGLAQQSLLDRDDPYYLDLKDIQFHGSKSLPPTEMAKTFLRELASYEHKLVPTDYLINQNEVEHKLEGLGFSRRVTDAVQNIMDRMRDKTGPELLSAFKDMNILIRNGARLNTPEKLFAGWFEQEQETIALYVDAIEKEFNGANIHNFRTLEEAISHFIIHEFTHHLVRTNQHKLIKGYQNAQQDKRKRTLVAEDFFRTMWNKYRERNVLPDDKMTALMKDKYSIELLSFFEEVACEAVAYENVMKMDPARAYQNALKTAQYRTPDGTWHYTELGIYLDAFNQRNPGVGLTIDDLHRLMAVTQAHASGKARMRLAALRDDAVKSKLQGAASFKLTKDAQNRKFSLHRASERSAGIYFRPSQINDDLLEEFQVEKDPEKKAFLYTQLRKEEEALRQQAQYNAMLEQHHALEPQYILANLTKRDATGFFNINNRTNYTPQEIAKHITQATSPFIDLLRYNIEVSRGELNQLFRDSLVSERERKYITNFLNNYPVLPKNTVEIIALYKNYLFSKGLVFPNTIGGGAYSQYGYLQTEGRTDYRVRLYHSSLPGALQRRTHFGSNVAHTRSDDFNDVNGMAKPRMLFEVQTDMFDDKRWTSFGVQKDLAPFWAEKVLYAEIAKAVEDNRSHLLIATPLTASLAQGHVSPTGVNPSVGKGRDGKPLYLNNMQARNLYYVTEGMAPLTYVVEREGDRIRTIEFSPVDLNDYATGFDYRYWQKRLAQKGLARSSEDYTVLSVARQMEIMPKETQEDFERDKELLRKSAREWNAKNPNDPVIIEESGMSLREFLENEELVTEALSRRTAYAPAPRDETQRMRQLFRWWEEHHSPVFAVGWAPYKAPDLQRRKRVSKEDKEMRSEAFRHAQARGRPPSSVAKRTYQPLTKQAQQKLMARYRKRRRSTVIRDIRLFKNRWGRGLGAGYTLLDKKRDLFTESDIARLRSFYGTENRLTQAKINPHVQNLYRTLNKEAVKLGARRVSANEKLRRTRLMGDIEPGQAPENVYWYAIDLSNPTLQKEVPVFGDTRVSEKKISDRNLQQEMKRIRQDVKRREANGEFEPDDPMVQYSDIIQRNMREAAAGGRGRWSQEALKGFKGKPAEFFKQFKETEPGPGYKFVPAEAKRKAVQMQHINKHVQSEAQEEASEVSRPTLTPRERRDINMIFSQAKSSGAIRQTTTNYPTSDIEQRIASLESELQNAIERKYLNGYIEVTDGKFISHIYSTEGQIKELKAMIADEKSKLARMKSDEEVRLEQQKITERFLGGKEKGTKYITRKNLTERLNDYGKFLREALRKYSKGGRSQAGPQTVKYMDGIKAYLGQIIKNGFTYLDINGETVTYTFKGEKTTQFAKRRVPEDPTQIINEKYQYSESAPLVQQINSLIAAINDIKAKVKAESKADVDRLKQSYRLELLKPVGLYDQDTQQTIWLPVGDYRMLQWEGNTVIHGLPETMFALNFKTGKMYSVDHIKVENTLLYDIKPEVDANFHGRDDDKRPEWFQTLPRSVRNAQWTDNFKNSLEKKFTQRPQTVHDRHVNPQMPELYEYGTLLKFYIAFRKKISPSMTDQDIRKELPDWMQEALTKPIIKAGKEDIEKVIGNYMDERHMAMLAGFNGARITSIITRRAWDRVKQKHPNMTLNEQKMMLETYLNIMTYANQEIIVVKDTDTYQLSDVGMGGNWQQGNINAAQYKGKVNTAERDTTIEIYKDLRNDLGNPVTPAEEKQLMSQRPTQLFWNLLDDKVFQDIVFLVKRDVEDVVFNELLESGLLDDTDNLANVRRGFTHIMWRHPDEDRQGISGYKDIKLSHKIPRHKYRTATEAVLATGRDPEFGSGLEAITNYAAVMGDYVSSNMQRINQIDIVKKFQELVPVDENGVPKVRDVNGKAYKLGYVAYKDDPEVVKQTERNTNFLATLGYIQMHEATGLVRRRGGVKQYPWVHRDIAPLLKQLYGAKEKSRAMNAILKLNGIVKRNIMFSPYNFAIQIASSPMLWLDDKAATFLPTLGKRAFDLGIKPLFWKGEKGQKLPGLVLGGLEQGVKQRRDPNPFAHLEDSEYDPEMVSLFIRHGAKNFNVGWVMESFFDSNELKKHPILRQEAENFWEIVRGKGGVDNYVFNHYVARIMYSFMTSMTQRFMKDGLSKNQAARLAVQFANDTSGMIDTNIYGAEGRLLQALLFARDFTMSFVRQVTGAAYGLPLITDKMDSVVGLNSFLHGDKTSAEKQFLARYYRAHLFKVLSTKLVLFSLLQFGLSYIADLWFPDDEEDKSPLAKRRWMMFNEPGKFGVIRTPFKADSGEPVYVDPLLWREATQFVTIFYGRGPQQYALGKLSFALKTASEQIQNKNYMGEDITDMSGALDFGSQMLDRAAHIGESALPTFLSPAGRANKPANIFSSAFGFPLKTGTAAKDPANLIRMRRAVNLERYYDNKVRKKMREASKEELRRMLFNKEISGTQYRNELMKRRNPEWTFRRRNTAKLRRHRRMRR
jgi:hypothetical protein